MNRIQRWVLYKTEWIKNINHIIHIIISAKCVELKVRISEQCESMWDNNNRHKWDKNVDVENVV